MPGAPGVLRGPAPRRLCRAQLPGRRRHAVQQLEQQRHQALRGLLRWQRQQRGGQRAGSVQDLWALHRGGQRGEGAAGGGDACCRHGSTRAAQAAPGVLRSRGDR